MWPMGTPLLISVVEYHISYLELKKGNISLEYFLLDQV